MNITIAGIGYIGLVHAVCFAEGGHDVTCIDEKEKVELLKSGNLPFYEPEVWDLLRQNRDMLHFTNNKEEAYRYADFIIIAIPPLINEDGLLNMDNIRNCVADAAKYAGKDCVITIKSPVPVGTHEEMEQMMNEELANNVRVEFVVNPDSLRLGSAVHDFFHASHIVIGIESEYGEAVMREAYKHVQSPFVIINRRSAELLKYAANGLKAVQNGFMLELAAICEKSGANIEDIIRGLEQDRRISKQFIQTNLGYGEVPYIKENQMLSYFSQLHEIDPRTLRAATETHEIHKWRLLNKARKYYHDFAGLSIAILGISCKPETDMIEHAPALSYIKVLLEEGGIIKVWDYAALECVRKIFGDDIEYCSSIEEAISGADICFIFTKWHDIKYFDVYDFTEYMEHPIVLDAVNCFSLCDVEEAGLVYESIGRKKIDGR